MTHKPLVLVSSNRKGGCSKTSTVFHTAGEFARRGNRVLLLDCDPQASLSQSLKPFGSRAIEQLNPERSVVALFDDRMDPSPENILYATDIENIYLVPSCDALTKFNYPDPTEYGFLQDSLRHFVTEVAGDFDVVLIDTPPNLQMLTWCALVAADYCLTPVVPEDYAAQGIVHVKRFIEAVQSSRNGDLRWMGLLIAMVQPRLGIHSVYEQVMRDAYAGLVLDANVPLITIFKECVSNKTPVTLYKPKVAAGKAIIALVDEIFARSGETHVGLKSEVPEPVKKTAKRKPKSKSTTTKKTTSTRKAA